METTIKLNLEKAEQRKALRALLDVLDAHGEDGLKISSGPVTVHTSTKDAKSLIDPEMTFAEGKSFTFETSLPAFPTDVDVEPIDVVGPVDYPEAEVEAEAEAEAEEAPATAPAAIPDAKKLVEAVVNVKTDTVETKGTIEKVVETLKTDDVKKIRSLLVDCSLAGKAPEAAEIVGGRAEDVPADRIKDVVDALTALAG